MRVILDPNPSQQFRYYFSTCLGFVWLSHGFVYSSQWLQFQFAHGRSVVGGVHSPSRQERALHGKLLKPEREPCRTKTVQPLYRSICRPSLIKKANGSQWKPPKNELTIENEVNLPPVPTSCSAFGEGFVSETQNEVPCATKSTIFLLC